MATLRSEREHAGPPLAPSAPVLYDVDADDDDELRPTPKRASRPARPSRCRRRPCSYAGDGRAGRARARPGRRARPVDAAAGAATSRAPAQQAINKAEVEARGRTLVESLDSHGVETQLVGQTVGPTVTRYELELGAGVKVARVTSLQPRHRLRDGGHRRAHPRPDPRPLGDRRRGAQPHPPAGRARRHHRLGRGQGRHAIRSTWRSARTSPAAPCSSTWPPRRTCSSPAPPAPASRAASTASSRRC